MQREAVNACLSEKVGMLCVDGGGISRKTSPLQEVQGGCCAVRLPSGMLMSSYAIARKEPTADEIKRRPATLPLHGYVKFSTRQKASQMKK